MKNLQNFKKSLILIVIIMFLTSFAFIGFWSVNNGTGPIEFSLTSKPNNDRYGKKFGKQIEKFLKDNKDRIFKDFELNKKSTFDKKIIKFLKTNPKKESKYHKLINNYNISSLEIILEKPDIDDKSREIFKLLEKEKKLKKEQDIKISFDYIKIKMITKNKKEIIVFLKNKSLKFKISTEKKTSKIDYNFKIKSVDIN